MIQFLGDIKSKVFAEQLNTVLMQLRNVQPVPANEAKSTEKVDAKMKDVQRPVVPMDIDQRRERNLHDEIRGEVYNLNYVNRIGFDSRAENGQQQEDVVMKDAEISEEKAMDLREMIEANRRRRRRFGGRGRRSDGLTIESTIQRPRKRNRGRGQFRERHPQNDRYLPKKWRSRKYSTDGADSQQGQYRRRNSHGRRGGARNRREEDDNQENWYGRRYTYERRDSWKNGRVDEGNDYVRRERRRNMRDNEGNDYKRHEGRRRNRRGGNESGNYQYRQRNSQDESRTSTNKRDDYWYIY